MQWNFLWVEIGTICLILCGFYHNQDGSFCEILKKVCFGGFLWIRQKRPSVIKNHLRAWLLNTIPMYGWNIVQNGEVDLWQSWFEVWTSHQSSKMDKCVSFPVMFGTCPVMFETNSNNGWITFAQLAVIFNHSRFVRPHQTVVFCIVDSFVANKFTLSNCSGI